MSNTFASTPATTYHGFIETTDDALLVFEACRLGKLQRRTRRLCDSERCQITSGSVFVWDEGESGIRRWTDGKRWSPSRVSGCFLVYTELEPKSSGERNTKANTASPTLHGSDETPRSGGLVKKALSLFTTHNSKLHLVCYYRKEDVDQGAIIAPSRDSLLCTIDIPRSLYPDILPEMVHVLSSPAITTATSAQHQLYHKSAGVQKRRRMSIANSSLVAKPSPLAKPSPVTQPRSSDSAVEFDERPLTAPGQQSPQKHAQMWIPAHIAAEKSDGSHCFRRRRDSIDVVPTRLVRVPTSRRYQTTTSCQDNEMLHRLDTASCKPALGVRDYMSPSAANDIYLHPPPSPAFLHMQSRLAEQNTTASFRCASHLSPSPFTDDSNTLPSIGSDDRYAMLTGPATVPSSRRNTVFSSDNAGHSGTETSLPSITELLNSISSADTLPSRLPLLDYEMESAGIQSYATSVRPLTNAPNPLPSLSSSAKARAKYLTAPWSRQLCNYSMKSTQVSPLVHDSYTIY
ncbi:Gluconate transport-inducing protein [Coemansia sp. BCRC 34962]|nr:Gluconate transport-inducing protein [Coemansia sp. BCRC 34962]